VWYSFQIGGCIRFIVLMHIAMITLPGAAAASPALAEPSACSLFKSHRGARLPEPEPVPFEAEASLIGAISRLPGNGEFADVFRLEIQKNPLSEPDRIRWLKCLYGHASLDSNHDGVPDWMAVVDQRPARMMLPQNPVPFQGARIPAAFRVSNPAARVLQARLYRDYGILALDQSADTSPVVLRALLLILDFQLVHLFHQWTGK
jgi:hypothetical protein